MNLSALKSPSFRWYYLGAIAAVNGLWIVRILIGWLAWELTRSASFVGLVAALSLLPSFLGSPFFGVMVDRANIKHAAYYTNTSMVLCVSALLAIHLAGLLNPMLLSIIAIAIGVAASAHHPVRMSLAPRLVKIEHVRSAIALTALNFNTARMISPALGGIIIDQLGITAALIIAILLYLPNLFVISFLKPRKIVKPKVKEAFITALSNGFKYLWCRAELRLVIAMTALMSLSIRGATEILPVVADGVFGKGAIGLGQLGSAVGLGAFCAAMTMALIATRSDKTISLQTFIIVAAGILTVALFGGSKTWQLTLTAAAVLGYCSTYLGINLQSAIQAELPDDMRGRVMSIWIVVAMGSSAIGALIIGITTEYLGLPFSTLLLTLFCLALFGWSVWPMIKRTLG